MALIISATIFWFVHMRRGVLRASKPHSIYFGPDGGSHDLPKIFASTFMHATGERGIVIEAMYMRVKVKQTTKNFTVWVYDQSGALRRGSGLFIGRSGIAANHHFILPSRSDKFDWQAGDYEVSLIAQMTGRKREVVLWTERLVVTEDQAKQLQSGGAGIYFDWDPSRHAYDGHIDQDGEQRRLKRQIFSKFAEAMSADQNMDVNADRMS